ncbi:hypothetical protein GGI35DRAFT_399298 [Trichoderma velutinum]
MPSRPSSSNNTWIMEPLGLQKWVCVQVPTTYLACPGAACALSLRYPCPYRYAQIACAEARGRRTLHVWSTRQRLIGCHACKAVPHAPCSMYPCYHDKRSEKKQRKKPLRFQPWSSTHLQQKPTRTALLIKHPQPAIPAKWPQWIMQGRRRGGQVGVHFERRQNASEKIVRRRDRQ